MNITGLQCDISWEKTKNNLKLLEKIFSDLEKTDLIVLPEMFATGFSMNVKKIAEPVFGETFKWMQKMAISLNTTIVGSIPTYEHNMFYNRLYVISSEKYRYYDKRHLFTMAGENNMYAKGNSKLIFEVKNFKICPLICYDLRFPLWSRNKTQEGEYDYDILIYIANWPSSRSSAWIDLLKARAIENLSYVVGINRFGSDGNGIQYNGSSRFYNFLGERMDHFKNDMLCIQQINLDKKELYDFRAKFPVLNDADNFTLDY